jgi:MYXO-CTERM domain-containing protein
MHAARFVLLFALVTAPLAASAGPAPPQVLIACHDAVGIPGGTASVEVTLSHQEDAMVVGTQNDLTYNDEILSIQRGDCEINPDIGPDSPFDKELQQNVLSDPPRVRGIIVALNNVLSIPSGVVLYTCRFRVAVDAAEGSYAITNGNLIASTATGMRLSVEGENCNVVVAEATVTPTPTPRCRGNEDCPSGQVCVDGECVTPTPTVTSTPTVRSATATPTATPVGFCEDNDDCPPGQVCIDNMCVTVTPTPQCREDMDCPSGEVCVDGMCVTSTPTATATVTPTVKKKGGGGGCSCEIDPGAPPYQASDVLAVLLPALVLLLRWRTRRAAP